MTDRLFADCCYGTEYQHRPDEPCPQDVPLSKLERGSPFRVSLADLIDSINSVDHAMRDERQFISNLWVNASRICEKQDAKGALELCQYILDQRAMQHRTGEPA